VTAIEEPPLRQRLRFVAIQAALKTTVQPHDRLYFFVGMAVAGFCLPSTGMVVGGVGGVFVAR
jgi:hypothetical protein